MDGSWLFLFALKNSSDFRPVTSYDMIMTIPSIDFILIHKVTVVNATVVSFYIVKLSQVLVNQQSLTKI